MNIFQSLLQHVYHRKFKAENLINPKATDVVEAQQYHEGAIRELWLYCNGEHPNLSKQKPTTPIDARELDKEIAKLNEYRLKTKQDEIPYITEGLNLEQRYIFNKAYRMIEIINKLQAAQNHKAVEQ